MPILQTFAVGTLAGDSTGAALAVAGIGRTFYLRPVKRAGIDDKISHSQPKVALGLKGAVAGGTTAAVIEYSVDPAANFWVPFVAADFDVAYTGTSVSATTQLAAGAAAAAAGAYPTTAACGWWVVNKAFPAFRARTTGTVATTALSFYGVAPPGWEFSETAA